MTICWKSDPEERTRFADLVQQFSNMLEQEAGYLNLHRSLSWRTRKKASRAKAQSVDKHVIEKEKESMEMDEVVLNDEYKEGEAMERNSAV